MTFALAKKSPPASRFLLSVILATCAIAAGAVTIQDTSTDSPEVFDVNGVTVIRLAGADYSVAHVPTIVSSFENSATKETHTELKNKLELGELVTREEALVVLQAYYEKNAFEKASVAIRGLKTGLQPTWSIWCANPWLFGCLEYQGASGTWVEFEVNGRNRSGGMTGFQRTIWMMRKFSSTQTVTPPQ